MFGMYGGKYLEFGTGVCIQCGKEFHRPLRFIENAKYCSRDCFYKSRETIITLNCSTCGKEFDRRPSALKNATHGYYFCSRKCKEIAQSVDGHIKEISPSHYKDGRSVYRKRAFNKFEKKCSRCGYEDDERMLDIHHRDNNHDNNNIDNLQVVCVWCHALYTRNVIGSLD